MEATKSRIVFRNASQRIFYLRPRPGQLPNQPNFLFGPGMTVEALDEQEETLLASMSTDIRDVAKETPALANTMADLNRQLAEAKAENEILKADKAALEKQAPKLTKQAASRASRK